MAEAPLVRVFGFRPTRPAFDNVIRDSIVPTICARPGVVDAYAGRHGPDELGPRLVVSVWESRAAMTSAFDRSSRPGGLHPEGLEGIADANVELLSAEIAFRTNRAPEPSRIIRILRGCAQPGQLERYVEETRAGVLADDATGHGPVAFYLARNAAPDAFVALSVWASWAAVERSTGGDVRQPLATRHPELIAAFDATHFEAIDL